MLGTSRDAVKEICHYRKEILLGLFVKSSLFGGRSKPRAARWCLGPAEKTSQTARRAKAQLSRPFGAGEDRLEQLSLLFQHAIDAFLDRIQRQEPGDRGRAGPPMRWARLIAWSSMAGFHQRSKRKT